MTFENALMLLSGVAWSIVYVEAIRVGFKDKSYAMPLWALALNLAWELLHAVFGYQAEGIQMQIVINAVWFLLDLGLLYTYFRFGKKYFPKGIRPMWFYIWGGLAIASAFIIQGVFINEFGLLMAAVYAAFLQNLLMSVLFITMLVQRGSSEGQSLRIAIAKCIGTVAPTILMGIVGIKGVMEASPFVLATGGLILVFDLAYIWRLANVINTEKGSLTRGSV